MNDNKYVRFIDLSPGAIGTDLAFHVLRSPLDDEDRGGAVPWN